MVKVQSFRHSSKLVHVECPLTKPCCVCDKRLLSAKWVYMRLAITRSISLQATHFDSLNRSGVTHECDGQTDRQTRQVELLIGMTVKKSWVKHRIGADTSLISRKNVRQAYDTVTRWHCGSRHADAVRCSLKRDVFSLITLTAAELWALTPGDRHHWQQTRASQPRYIAPATHLAPQSVD